MDLREREFNGMEWTDVSEDKEHWRAHVNSVMNNPVS
jgi:hypothetical protein